MTISSSPLDNFFIETSVFPLLIAIFIFGYFFINVTRGLNIKDKINEFEPPILILPVSKLIYFEKIFSALFIVSMLSFIYSYRFLPSSVNSTPDLFL